MEKTTDGFNSSAGKRQQNQKMLEFKAKRSDNDAAGPGGGARWTPTRGEKENHSKTDNRNHRTEEDEA